MIPRLMMSARIDAEVRVHFTKFHANCQRHLNHPLPLRCDTKCSVREVCKGIKGDQGFRPGHTLPPRLPKISRIVTAHMPLRSTFFYLEPSEHVEPEHSYDSVYLRILLSQVFLFVESNHWESISHRTSFQISACSLVDSTPFRPSQPVSLLFSVHIKNANMFAAKRLGKVRCRLQASR